MDAITVAPPASNQALAANNQLQTANNTQNTGAQSAATTPRLEAGAGPAPAASEPAVLGTHILNPPNGEVRTITLPDGSQLVPIARVLPNGQTAPLTGAPFAGSAQGALAAPETIAAPAFAAPAANPAPAVPAASAAPAVPENNAAVNVARNEAAQAAGSPGAADGKGVVGGGLTADTPAAYSRPATGDEPKGFIYNSRYFAKFIEAQSINLHNQSQVERLMARAAIAYLLEEEPDVDDFGAEKITMRRADTVGDQDLFTVNKDAYWIADVHGTTGTGQSKVIPLVMNNDGSVYVDPRARRF